MSMTNESASYFSQVAGQWDKISAGYFTGAVRDTAIAKAYLRPDMVVADIGAGTGFLTAGLAPLVEKVYLLDGSAEMLDTARKNLAGYTNTEFRLSDATALNLPDEAVDAVFANMYLHHCTDPLAAIREMTRIIKPGGRLVITDADMHNHTWMQEEMADVWLGFDRDQIRAWFAEAGLVNILADCTGQNCCAESQNKALADGKNRSAKVSIFVAVGTKRVKMQAFVKEAYSNAAQEKCGCGNSASEKSIKPAENQMKSSCCSVEAIQNMDVLSARIYSKKELASAPTEAGEISLGCGNPFTLAHLHPGDVVVDIGSGGGLDSFLAAGKVGSTGKVIGVDMTPAMLERARLSASKAGITNVEFRFGQAEALPVEDYSVDVVMSNCVINLCEDKGIVFREIYRILKPGGRLIVNDIVTDGAFLATSQQNSEQWAACISGALPEKEYTDLISQAGFKKIEIKRSTATDEIAGVKFYSASVTASKPKPANKRIHHSILML